MRYPIGRLLDEAEIVAERLGQFEGQRASLTYMALSAIPSMGVKADSTKKRHGDFMKVIKRLLGAN